MTEQPMAAHGLTGAAASLRDSAKWLVGGVVATAAGVFAGSSLSNLGSLDPAHDGGRLALAGCGALLGFSALAMIAKFAIDVLTVESVTLRQLASAENSTRPEDEQLKQVAEEMVMRHAQSIPSGFRNFSELLADVDAKLADPAANRAFLTTAASFDARVMPDAGFRYVRHRFERLRAALLPAVAAAILGFGTFAWAANPPKADRPAPPASNIFIIRDN